MCGDAPPRKRHPESRDTDVSFSDVQFACSQPLATHIVNSRMAAAASDDFIALAMRGYGFTASVYVGVAIRGAPHSGHGLAAGRPVRS
jgi:hypothetical protein